MTNENNNFDFDNYSNLLKISNSFNPGDSSIGSGLAMANVQTLFDTSSKENTLCIVDHVIRNNLRKRELEWPINFWRISSSVHNICKNCRSVDVEYSCPEPDFDQYRGYSDEVDQILCEICKNCLFKSGEHKRQPRCMRQTFRRDESGIFDACN